MRRAQCSDAGRRFIWEAVTPDAGIVTLGAGIAKAVLEVSRDVAPGEVLWRRAQFMNYAGRRVGTPGVMCEMTPGVMWVTPGVSLWLCACVVSGLRAR